jgi:hypothetical protein
VLAGPGCLEQVLEGREIVGEFAFDGTDDERLGELEEPSRNFRTSRIRVPGDIGPGVSWLASIALACHSVSLLGSLR